MTAPRIRTDDTAAVLDLVEDATRRLLDTVAAMRPDQVGEPSLLPDWTRGHVLAHLARNADALTGVLEGAQEGRAAAMYASEEARAQGIADGAGRPPRDQAADIEATAERFARAARETGGAAWGFEVVHRSGARFPASALPWKRLAEVEYHHVDLDLGYRPKDWPEEFVGHELALLAGRFAVAEEVPPVLLRVAETGAEFRIGAAAGPAVTAEGAAGDLLAWLAGRADGSALIVHRGGRPVAEPARVLPALPAMA
ncbi:maleylpyruvate isomerase family mycothiol-dependent enzyme [Streptomonospora nanhaiensis]|uniref:Maleylpyruvate isomerase n=1 Tax=Streptomonospora nanhaiensis TaxID=1323731 RepID=A0A853BP55_9ACTN|nr:maleylpyruvate isomerase family mycothiol-dependent enzyme [Streptomonospora nanhaiensis]MBV2363912.1 maleylpyruvate isomerase family mycothiol-dependent enzyme [Streptomonospora nanhaiensis]MBX9388731.1 maleylpyruvate isomerase family mycothiol-dependent enzyme [Streptomonospora nanhaiensis]NYI96780.1 maleylpyruvate isomerase [Streptomonospora nanhaiensis]